MYPKIEKLYDEDHDFFSDLTYQHLLFWLKELEIDTTILKSSDLDVKTKKSALILDLCLLTKADKYISGALGRDYLDEKIFNELYGNE